MQSILKKYYVFACFAAVILFVDISKAQDTTMVVQQQDTTEASVPDSIVYNQFRAADFINSNAEEMVDVFVNIAGFHILDMGAFGQFSSMSYRGTEHSSVVPLLNGVPLESWLNGSWNWRDIPFYTVERLNCDNDAALVYPGVYKVVDIQTKNFVEGDPVSRVNYRVGDYGFSHTDVSLSRKLPFGLDFYGAGSTQYYTGIYLDRYENRFRGSNIWLDLELKKKTWRMRWNVLLSDKNNPELTEIPLEPTYAIKSAPISRNTKMITYTVEHEMFPWNTNAQLYFLETKEQASGDILYGDYYTGSEKTFGMILRGSIVSNKNMSVDLSYFSTYTHVNSSYFDRDKTTSRQKLTMLAERRLNKDFKLKIAPEINMPVNYEDADYIKPVYLLGKITGQYDTGGSVTMSCTAGRSLRPVSMQNNYVIQNAGRGDDNIYDIVSSEILHELSLDLNYNYKNGFFVVNPFFIHVDNPYEFNLLSGISESAGDDSDAVVFFNGSGLSYGGLSLAWHRDFGKYLAVSGNYTYLSGEKSRMYAPNHSAFFRLNLRKIDDFITSKKLDTDIQIMGMLCSQKKALNYFPLYQQFGFTDIDMDVTGFLKVRGSAQIRSVNLFYEADIVSRNDYFNILGYPVRDRIVRAGVEWIFRN